ncbi:hypothetical protein Cni_G01892 [Canna indica]|uniref:Uncharacterized protein n=1 Tax=Canna indica TaxID=4628 RepID=A0AAQ3JNF4_9LILI|nr:hypothetical protein Cni_G01892 [Canna indica]
MVEDATSPRREPRKRAALSRCPRIRSQKSLLAAAEAIEEARDIGGGAVRVKIVVTKKQLRQMVASLGQGGSNAGAAGTTTAAAASNVELLLHVLRRRHMKRAETAGRRHGGRWRPALQSIPEEVIQD